MNSEDFFFLFAGSTNCRHGISESSVFNYFDSSLPIDAAVDDYDDDDSNVHLYVQRVFSVH